MYLAVLAVKLESGARATSRYQQGLKKEEPLNKNY